MKKLILVAILITLSSAAFAQVPKIEQYGKVRKQNSGNKPIAGVEILFTDAKATHSDGVGQFRLVFQDKKRGDLIFKEKIYKRGYELVNEKEVEVLKISSKDDLAVDIILAPKAAWTSPKSNTTTSPTKPSIPASTERKKPYVPNSKPPKSPKPSTSTKIKSCKSNTSTKKQP